MFCPTKAVLAAVVVWTGLQPGMEGFGAVLGVAGVATLSSTRNYATVALTDEDVSVYENKSRVHPFREAARFHGYSSIGEVNSTVLPMTIVVAGIRYWVAGDSAFQMYRLRRFVESNQRRSPTET